MNNLTLCSLTELLIYFSGHKIMDYYGIFRRRIGLGFGKFHQNKVNEHFDLHYEAL